MKYSYLANDFQFLILGYKDEYGNYLLACRTLSIPHFRIQRRGRKTLVRIRLYFQFLILGYLSPGYTVTVTVAFNSSF